MSMFKGILNRKSGDASGQNQPQLGFQMTLNELTKELIVKVIGARQLPTVFGSTKPEGYLIKVTIFPQKEKFETKILPQSWPTFNEEFKIKIRTVSSKEDILKNKFVSLTAYAILIGEKTEESKPKNIFFRTLSNLNIQQNSKIRRSFRHSLKSRRTIGTVTFDLERKIFSLKLRDNIISTTEIWRDIKEIWNAKLNEHIENLKGSLEVNMVYTIGETSTDNFVEVGVTKLRCKVQTMQEHEKIGGKLYIKISAIEMGDVIQKIKSDRFDPTISLKLEKNSAKLKLNIDDFNKNQVQILIRLICTPLIGQKIELGRIEIDHRSDIWKETIDNPMETTTKTINFK